MDTGFLRDFRGLLFLRTEDESGFAPLGLRFGKRSSSLSAVPAIRIPEGGGIDGGQAPPPTVTLSASPTTIDRGQSTMLTWSSTNAESAEITPDIGGVPTSGSRKVSPNATTTYRITVTGADGQTATAVVTVTVAVSERVALGTLFDALGGSNWTRSDNWLTDAPLGDWYGVEVDSQGRVIGLRMAEWVDTEDGRQEKVGIGLTGSIPLELGSLSHLRVLDLSRNYLEGEIPPELGSLASLETLILADNGLGGPIPPELGNLSNLTWLDLGHNDLIGPIPPELGNLSNLTTLWLWSNILIGPIPPELGGLAKLTRLGLSQNALDGLIPAELGRLANLRSLSLSSNDLIGPIPPELGNLSNLTWLNLTDNDLIGPIPPELGNLSNLTGLVLWGNRLTGPLPQSFLKLRQLELFRVSKMDLCTPDTSTFVAWLQGLEDHDAAYVSFCNAADVAALESLYADGGGADWIESSGWLGEGVIGEWYGVSADSLGRVTELDLAHNGLTGTLPANLGDLTQLTRLRIGGNALTGRLPLSLARVPLEDFHFVDTELCAPPGEAFQAWLNVIPSHEGTGVQCAPLSDHENLEALYEATDGPNWTNNQNWHTEVPLSQWHGVRVDDEGRVTRLDLSNNNLTGPIPLELGNLANLTTLSLSRNSLIGSIPSGLGSLSRLTLLDLSGNALEEAIPPELGSLSRLTLLDLSGNALEEAIPPELGSLSRLTLLDLGNNALEEAIPPELGNLANLTTLSLSRNSLIGSIPSGLGSLSRLTLLDLSGNALEGAISPELGSLSRLTLLDLSGNALEGAIPPELGSLDNLTRMNLQRNNLTGPIPPELGNLSSVTDFLLHDNILTGPIPGELGHLATVKRILLSGNALTGPIPVELGNLSTVKILSLSSNRLTGPIPPQLGNLSSVTYLAVDGNALSGQLPSALGNLSTLEELNLSNNDLMGTVPPEFGDMPNLRTLALANNGGLAGALPTELAALRQLEALLVRGTGLCAPLDPRFREWIASVFNSHIVRCYEDGPPKAYLIQAVQSPDFPVPLVAGKRALLRGFPTAGRATSATIPDVRARFYLNGRETHTVNIPGKPQQIPTEVNEASLSASVNAEIPAEVIQPGLEMMIEVDPDGTLDPALGVTKRIPETGRVAVDVHRTPLFDLTLIPFIWNDEPDYSIVDLIGAIAADPEEHEMLGHMRTSLPVGDLDATAHEPVLSSTNNGYTILAETRIIRAMEGGTGYYMGMITRPSACAGVAERGGKVSFSHPYEGTVAHELGHNMNLQHAPCGVLGDPLFPYPTGSIGAWGYDFLHGQLIPPFRKDLMSYCGPTWISDYHFTNALRYLLHTATGGGVSSLVAAPGKSLLLWGGLRPGGAPFLEPAFVVEAPASLPRSTGEYQIIGRTAGGDELFSLPFPMPELADGDGRSSFAFVLPVEPGWADQLASITLLGPGGSVTLDQDTNRPITILQNPGTGQIRAILRGAEAAPQNLDATVSALSLDPGLERLSSLGIPNPEDWTR